MKLLVSLLYAGALSSSLICANASALIEAAKTNDMNGVKAALSAGENVDTAGKGGARALMWAAKNNQPDIVDLLLAKGADVNAKTNVRYRMTGVVQWSRGVLYHNTV